MDKRHRWTSPYFDYEPKEKPCYLRFIPYFMDVQSAGYSHGLSLHTCRFKTKAEASAFSDVFEKYMQESMYQYLDDKRQHEKQGLVFKLNEQWATSFAYVDSTTEKMVYTVSFSHPYGNAGKIDFHNGFPIGGNVFDNKESADKFALIVNKFMLNMMSQYESYILYKTTQKYHWVSRHFDYGNFEKNCVANLTPNFMDMTHTSFPNGIPIGNIRFKDEIESIDFFENLEHFMEDFIGSYEEQKDDAKEKGEDFKIETQWTKVYAAPDDEMTVLEHHVRFQPPYGSLEDSGWPHGLLIGNVCFKTKPEAEAFAILINQFMNQMMVDYEEKKEDKLEDIWNQDDSDTIA